MDIMLDLETWGERAGCDIRSIGAVVFNPRLNHVSHLPSAQFYTATENPETNIAGYFDGTGTRRKYPLWRSLATIEWWNNQTSEAQSAFEYAVDLHEGLVAFRDWLNAVSGDTDKIRIWGNGPQFDVSILEAAYHALGMDVPWHYRAPRDFRTIVEAAGIPREEYCNYGEAHNALHDAIAQAMTVCDAYNKLGLRVG